MRQKILCAVMFTIPMIAMILYWSDSIFINSYQIFDKKIPVSVAELQKIVTESSTPLSLMGGNFSQGGQTVIEYGTVIDMKKMNQILRIDTMSKTITVQAGCTWRQIQEAIDPYNLSIQVMQSYNDFTVGGSLSVNVHARDLRFGNMLNSVLSLTIMLANGSLVIADKINNKDLFSAAIGGYGLIGIIVDATLQLIDNIPLERSIAIMHIDRFQSFFASVMQDQDAVFHSTLLWPKKYEMAMGITFYKTKRTTTIQERLQKSKIFYLDKMIGSQLLTRISGLKNVRPFLESLTNADDMVVWKNYEMGYSLRELEPFSRFFSTSTLQEYFIPCDKLLLFIKQLRSIAADNNINILNAAIRHVPQDNFSLLAYAKKESFSIVLYINDWNTKKSLLKAENYTQKIIEMAIGLGGTYYLPYQLFASQAQFEAAYQGVDEFLAVKRKYDPNNKFQNMFYKKYMHAKNMAMHSNHQI
jgi:FAD/FMN-containing dehydrogenase